MLSADLALFVAEFGAGVVVPSCELLLDLLALSFEKEVHTSIHTYINIHTSMCQEQARTKLDSPFLKSGSY